MRPGQHLPAPGHVTQRKPLASQAILLQVNDCTFLYDLEGQLQFPIEAAVTSLKPSNQKEKKQKGKWSLVLWDQLASGLVSSAWNGQKMVHAFSNISLDRELILLSFAPSKRLQTSSWLACAYNSTSTVNPEYFVRTQFSYPGLSNLSYAWNFRTVAERYRFSDLLFTFRMHFIFVRKPPRTKYTKITCIRNILDLQYGF